jgi:hypothetical protein
VRYIVILVWGTLPQSPTTFRLVFQSPTTRIYRLDGSAPYFGAAGCQVTSGDRDSAWIVCARGATFVRRQTWFPWLERRDRRPPNRHYGADGLFQAVTVSAGSHHSTFSFVTTGMNGALLGLLAGVALMLVPMARSASSFGVRR